MNGFGTLNEYHYEVFKIVVIMIFIIQTHCHLLQLLSYKRTATNFLSAMHSKAADWWKPCDLSLAELRLKFAKWSIVL